MQERIIEIIVYLLSSIHHEKNQKDKVDLTRNLIAKGYIDTEITLAFSWIFNHLKRPDQKYQEEGLIQDEFNDEYPDIERLVISPEAYGYLLQMLHLGVLNDREVEMFVEKAMAYGKYDINVDDLKSIVATIIFDSDNKSFFNDSNFFRGDAPVH